MLVVKVNFEDLTIQVIEAPETDVEQEQACELICSICNRDSCKQDCLIYCG